MASLHGRLLVAATIVLAGFLGAAGIALHKAFRDSAEAALKDRLLGHVYALLAAANEDRQGRMLWPKTLPDQRFSNPDSGLYALVAENNVGISWRSPSLTGQSDRFLQLQSPGKRGWYTWRNSDKELLVLNFGIAWEDYQGHETIYTLTVAADIAPFLNEVQGFKTALWTWLGGLAGMLLVAQGLILQWGLKPLRTVAEDLRRIENGETESLQGAYPKELTGLTGNLNALIGNARAKQQRYRNSLDDLAHSLKTPLAILRNVAQDSNEIYLFKITVHEQVQRMDTIIQHQLRRAIVVGHGPLGRAIPVSPLLARLTNSMRKVYRNKAVHIELNLTETRFFGDEADFLEVLGNIIDNGFKYGRSRVKISSRQVSIPQSPKQGLQIVVEDDGPGIAPSHVDKLMQRGARLDESIPGEGIGLSVAKEIITLYGGHMKIDPSTLGGACLTVYWPPY